MQRINQSVFFHFSISRGKGIVDDIRHRLCVLMTGLHGCYCLYSDRHFVGSKRVFGVTKSTRTFLLSLGRKQVVLSAHIRTFNARIYIMRGRWRVLPQPGCAVIVLQRFFFILSFRIIIISRRRLWGNKWKKKNTNNNRPRIGRLAAANNHNNNNDRIMFERVLSGGGGGRNIVVTDTRCRRVAGKWPYQKKTVFFVHVGTWSENFY